MTFDLFCILFSSVSFFVYVVAYFVDPHMKQEFKRFNIEKLGLTIIVLEFWAQLDCFSDLNMACYYRFRHWVWGWLCFVDFWLDFVSKIPYGSLHLPYFTWYLIFIFSSRHCNVEILHWVTGQRMCEGVAMDQSNKWRLSTQTELYSLY